MSKTLLLLLLPFASAATISRDSLERLLHTPEDSPACLSEQERFQYCFEHFEEDYGTVYETHGFAVLANQTLMQSFFDDLAGGSRCIGETTCKSTSFYKWIVDTFVFAGNHIYGESFDCFAKESLHEKLLNCVGTYSLFTNSASDLEDVHIIARCTAHRLGSVCSVRDRNNFIKAAYAVIDIVEQVKEKKWETRTENMRFDATDYDNIFW